MTTTTINRRGAAHVTSPRSMPELFGRIASGVARYVTRSRAQRQLESLDDRLLQDIGLSRSDIHYTIWGDKS